MFIGRIIPNGKKEEERKPVSLSELLLIYRALITLCGNQCKFDLSGIFSDPKKMPDMDEAEALRILCNLKNKIGINSEFSVNAKNVDLFIEEVSKRIEVRMSISELAGILHSKNKEE